MRGNSSVPIGSMCTIGLRLTRPRFLAVSSPSLQAIQACADSWKDRLKRRTTYVVRPSAMCWGVRSDNRPPEEPRMVAQGRRPAGRATPLVAPSSLDGRHGHARARRPTDLAFLDTEPPVLDETGQGLATTPVEVRAGLADFERDGEREGAPAGDEVEEPAEVVRRRRRVPVAQGFEHSARRRALDFTAVEVHERETSAHETSSAGSTLQRPCARSRAGNPWGISRDEAAMRQASRSIGWDSARSARCAQEARVGAGGGTRSLSGIEPR